ncbi:ABC transporter substrate-binding protein [Sphingomonas oleivorans]|uniref:ABC transporter substrate-binding protein n=1 Tax=Sphingomonas oleivorans TaxID=1735121 RepID=A0A2T5G0N5_9SPHN|nr:ABC transporter substrate-binding protein [Sphingomonas oleivorans]PTQ12698.1 ABC transporter substrate-binding protein [Sphingomonas oleivorans]
MIGGVPSVSRRDVVRLLAAGGVATVLPGALAGCGVSDPRPPVKGGRLRVATNNSSTADTLDPAKQAVATDYCRCHMFYNGLTSLDEHSRAQLALAESIESRDATVWTVKLRRDVRFHDGKKLTADDVVYSLRRHADPAVGSKARVFASQFAEIRAMAPDEVRITLIAPNADLPVILGINNFQIIRDGTTDFTTANGTGPFRCKEYTPGVRSVSVRNEDYWRRPPHLGEVELFAIADENARVNALLSGDVDLINAINPRITKQLRRAGLEIFESKSGGFTDLVIRLDQAPGHNPDFVLGMKYLLDRATMRNAIFRDYAMLANDHPIPPTNPYFNPDLPQRPYDLDRARFHFRRAGLLGATVPIVTAPPAEKSDDIAVLMQASARKAGLNLDIRRVPADGYWANHWMKVPVGFGNVNARPTADIIFTQFFKSDAPWNESGWKNERFDRLLLEARADRDEGRRRAIYQEMQRMIHAQSGVGIPLFISTLDAHSPRLKGMRPMPQGGLMGGAFAEHVWLEDA